MIFKTSSFKHYHSPLSHGWGPSPKLYRDGAIRAGRLNITHLSTPCQANISSTLSPLATLPEVSLTPPVRAKPTDASLPPEPRASQQLLCAYSVSEARGQRRTHRLEPTCTPRERARLDFISSLVIYVSTEEQSG